MGRLQRGSRCSGAVTFCGSAKSWGGEKPGKSVTLKGDKIEKKEKKRFKTHRFRTFSTTRKKGTVLGLNGGGERRKGSG